MGGVDKLDWYVNKYRIKIRGKKWYFPLFTNAIDVAMVNAYVLYCFASSGNKITLLEFRRAVTKAYLEISSDLSDPRNAGRPSLKQAARKRVSQDVRFSPVGHILSRTVEGRQRKCAICKKNARKECLKCNVGLHIDCFQSWHKK